MRHRGRLWRLADFVGGAGGSVKPSTEECCGEAGTQGGQQSLRLETFTQTNLDTKPKATLRFGLRAEPSSCNNAAERCSGDLSVCQSQDICWANTEEPINLVLRRGAYIQRVYVSVPDYRL